MNVRLPATFWALPLLLLPLNAVAEDKEDSKTHSIRFQLLMVESSGNLDQEQLGRLSGPSKQVMSAINELASQEKATIINHVELTLLEEQEAMLQVGETVAIRTGSVRSGSGRESKVYQDVSIGTLIKVMTKVVDDQILMDLDFSKSFITPDGDDESESPQGTSQFTHQTTLRIDSGDAQLISRMASRESEEQGHAVQLIVAAEVLGASQTAQITRLRSFPRQPPRSSSASGRSFGNRSAGSRPTGSRYLGPPSSRSSLQNIPNEARRRFASAMFDRADENKDGVISDNELPRLNARDANAKTPIKKDQYLDWMSSNWPPKSRRGPSPSSGRPSSAGSKEQPSKSESKPKTDENEKKDGQKLKIGDTQIEVVPELSTVIIRGAKPDVQRVIGVIKEIEKSDEEEKENDGDKSDH